MEITQEHQKLLLFLIKAFESKVIEIYADKDVYRKSLVDLGMDFMELQEISDSELDDGLIALNDNLELLKADLKLIGQQSIFMLRVFISMVNRLIPSNESQYESQWDIHWDILVLLNEYYKLNLNTTPN